MNANKGLLLAGLLLTAACGTAQTSQVTSIAGEQASVIDLAGRTYSRTFETQPGFGQPGGKRTHIIAFSTDGQSVTDNSSTFFGNPPEHGAYILNDHFVALALASVTGAVHNVSYTLSADGKTLTGEAGAVLTLVEETPDSVQDAPAPNH